MIAKVKRLRFGAVKETHQGGENARSLMDHDGM